MLTRSRIAAILGGLASQNEATRETAVFAHIRELVHKPIKEGKARHYSVAFGLGNDRFKVNDYHMAPLFNLMSLWDLRLCWTAITREASVEKSLVWQGRKMRTKMAEDEVSALNDIDYVLMNVSRNLWVGPNGTFTKDAGEAAVFKRIPALDQFVEACKSNASDFNVPVRLQDLVLSKMDLDN